jgi:hypothetical protein
LSPADQLTLETFQEQTVAEFKAIRREFHGALDRQQKAFGPALAFYERVNNITLGLRDVGRFAKWGAGVGASVVIIVGGLHGLGIW